MTTRKQLEKEARVMGLTGLRKYKNKKSLAAAIMEAEDMKALGFASDMAATASVTAERPKPEPSGKKCSNCRHDPGRGEHCKKTGETTPVKGCGYWRKRQ